MGRTKGSLGKPKPNKFHVEGNVVIFNFHKKDGSLREETFIVDVEDLPLVKPFRWCLQRGKYAYNPKAGLLHRFLLKAEKDVFVDHKDRDGFNNRRENLRICTGTQNLGNSKVPKTNTTGFKGVYTTDNCKKPRTFPFMSKIQFEKKHIHIGYYMTAEEAALAYDKKARELFGEFARTNF